MSSPEMEHLQKTIRDGLVILAEYTAKLHELIADDTQDPEDQERAAWSQRGAELLRSLADMKDASHEDSQ